MATQGGGPMSRRQEKELLRSFLINFSVNQNGRLVQKYHNVLQEIVNRTCKRLDIHLDDLRQYLDEWDASNQGSSALQLLDQVKANTMHYIKLFAEAADEELATMTSSIAFEPDVWDQLQDVRLRQIEKNKEQPAVTEMVIEDTAAPIDQQRANKLPPALTRRYDVYILPEMAIPVGDGSSDTVEYPVTLMRKVNAGHVGKLVRVRGVITHVTDVKPLASVITYTDSSNGVELYQEVLGRTFMPLEYADKPSGAKWEVPPQMQTRGTKFIKFQEARLQESSSEVPEGATPRTLRLHLRGEVTRSVSAGDHVILSGVYLPEPFAGWKAMKAGLLTSTFLEVMGVQQCRASYSSMELSPQDYAMVEQLGQEGHLFDRLAASIAPEIYGMLDVKKALLLQMVGGVPRSFPDGMKLRGDVHVCLMGDPGVAKSQLLKHVAKIAPRAVYTTGKGSSGVGLTAAVLRNQVTKELVLEGGALVLADMGICCIDEFDKMEEADRTNIHEVMEQQTVSIAKAGITTTLNTRTTILAAANPAFGRWNSRKSPAENINMPPALLSRFDIMWLLLDKEDPDKDRRLAQHILGVHQGLSGAALAAAAAAAGEEDSDLPPPVTPQQLRTYIAISRSMSPWIPPELRDYIVAHYVSLRQKEKENLDNSYITPRTLMSVLRLSQAIAKLRFDDRVSRADVDAAIQLMAKSQASILPAVEARAASDPSGQVYQAARDWAVRSRQVEVPVSELEQLASKMGLRNYAEAVQQAIHEYEGISVWTVKRDKHNIPASVIFDEADVDLQRI